MLFDLSLLLGLTRRGEEDTVTTSAFEVRPRKGVDLEEQFVTAVRTYAEDMEAKGHVFEKWRIQSKATDIMWPGLTTNCVNCGTNFTAGGFKRGSLTGIRVGPNGWRSEGPYDGACIPKRTTLYRGFHLWQFDPRGMGAAEIVKNLEKGKPGSDAIWIEDKPQGPRKGLGKSWTPTRSVAEDYAVKRALEGEASLLVTVDYSRAWQKKNYRPAPFVTLEGFEHESEVYFDRKEKIEVTQIEIWDGHRWNSVPMSAPIRTYALKTPRAAGHLAGGRAVTAMGRADSLYGKGLDALFPLDWDTKEPSPTAQAPWQPAGFNRSITPRLTDPATVEHGVANPNFVMIDPRDLYATQGGLQRAGIEYYLSGEWERFGRTFADDYQPGNRYPVVYVQYNGKRVILAGHHRIAAALLKGKQIRVNLIESPEYRDAHADHSHALPGRAASGGRRAQGGVGGRGSEGHRGRSGGGASRGSVPGSGDSSISSGSEGLQAQGGQRTAVVAGDLGPGDKVHLLGEWQTISRVEPVQLAKPDSGLRDRQADEMLRLMDAGKTVDEAREIVQETVTREPGTRSGVRIITELGHEVTWPSDYVPTWGAQRTAAYGSDLIARGLNLSVKKPLAEKIVNGTVRAQDFVNALMAYGGLGEWWGIMGVFGDIEDFKDYAYKSLDPELNVKGIWEEYQVDQHYGWLDAECDVVLIAKRPVVNGKLWDPDDNPLEMGGLMGNSYLPDHQPVDLVEVRYNAGWGWKSLPARGIRATAALQGKDYEGTVGDPSHITRSEQGVVPTSAVAHLLGVKGEKPGEHRNKQGAAWQDFLDDIRRNGIREPIFITVDYGEQPKISEGNHRRDAAVELDLPGIPAEIRYFGHAEQQTRVAVKTGAVVVPDDADLYGKQLYGGDITQPGGAPVRGTVMDPHDLPSTLYHVTTNLSAVRSGGLKAGGSGGLGGDSRDRMVSLTLSHKIATDLARPMRLMAAVARELRSVSGRREQSQMIIERFQDFALSEGWHWQGALHDFQLDDYDFGDWSTQFFVSRQSHGHVNPIFFGVTIDGWAKVDPSNVGIVIVSRQVVIGTGALVTNFDVGRGGLEEVRVYGDVAISGTTAGARGDLPEGLTFEYRNPMDPAAYFPMAVVTAHLDGEEVGGLSWHTKASPGLHDEGQVGGIYVSEAFQRRGIATVLWKEAKKYEPNLKHSHALTNDGIAWSRTVSGKRGVATPLELEHWRPTRGMFAPGMKTLDPRVFDTRTEKMLPIARSDMWNALDAYWRPLFGDWTQWARLYLVGSGASYWWDSDSDMDLMVGVDLDRLREARPANKDIDDGQIIAHLNKTLMDLRPSMAALVFEPGAKPADVTYFVNPGSYDINLIHPYAAYSLDDDDWVVHPPVLPANWGPDSIPEEIWRKCEMAAREAEQVLSLPEPERTVAGTVYFDWVHEGRRASYSAYGGGWLDEGNVIYQFLAQRPDKLLRRLYLCKHPDQATAAEALEKVASSYETVYGMSSGEVGGRLRVGQARATQSQVSSLSQDSIRRQDGSPAAAGWNQALRLRQGKSGSDLSWEQVHRVHPGGRTSSVEANVRSATTTGRLPEVEVRHYVGAVQRDVGGPERSLRDVSQDGRGSTGDSSSRRSLSQHGQDQGFVVRAVQSVAGSRGGRSGGGTEVGASNGAVPAAVHTGRVGKHPEQATAADALEKTASRVNDPEIAHARQTGQKMVLYRGEGTHSKPSYYPKGSTEAGGWWTSNRQSAEQYAHSTEQGKIYRIEVDPDEVDPQGLPGYFFIPDSKVRERRTLHMNRTLGSSRLTLENIISVAEEVLERGNQAGRMWDIPVPLLKNFPDGVWGSDYRAAVKEPLGFVNKVLTENGHHGNIRLYSSGYDMEGSQAATDGMNYIQVKRTRVNSLTLLHECAHILDGTPEGGHTNKFVNTAFRLYSRYISPAAGQKFMEIVDSVTAPKKTAVWDVPGGIGMSGTGYWDRSGDEPVWVQPHQELVASALAEWKGYNSDVTRWITRLEAGTQEEATNGTAKIDRARAVALLEEFAKHGKSNSKTLYRGDSRHPSTYSGWSELRSVARTFGGGQVWVIPPGSARGLRIADYINSGLNDSEREWIVANADQVAQQWKPKTAVSQVVEHIPLDKILPSEYHSWQEAQEPFSTPAHQQRLKMAQDELARGEFSPAEVVAQPDGFYRLKNGHHRWVANRIAGYETMPCIVKRASKTAIYRETTIGPLYHGTTDRIAPQIVAHGFQANVDRGGVVYLTPYPDLARRYAEGAVQRAGGGKPMVLKIESVTGVSGAEVGYMDPVKSREGGAHYQDKGPEVVLLDPTRAHGISIMGQKTTADKKIKQPAGQVQFVLMDKADPEVAYQQVLGHLEGDFHEGSIYPTERTTYGTWDRTLMHDLTKSHGFSFHDHPGDGPSDGFMVSINRKSEEVVPLRDVSPETIADYMSVHQQELKDPSNFLGGWVYKGNVFLDVSRHVQDEDHALKLAKANKQLGIYDLVNGQTIMAG